MTNVYAWPPVLAVGAEWTIDYPLEKSRSFVSGKRYASASKRARRLATVEVSSVANDGYGAGYMEALKRMIKGGESLVRLESSPINWHLMKAEYSTLYASAEALEWTSNSEALQWTTGGGELLWFSGNVFTVLDSAQNGDFWGIQISGLPPGIRVVGPGDFITLVNDDSGTTQTTMVVRAQIPNNLGRAWVRIFDQPISGVTRVLLNASESAVFEPTSIPRAVQPANSDWSYTWEFQEVFSDEVDGGFTEIDPW